MLPSISSPENSPTDNVAAPVLANSAIPSVKTLNGTESGEITQLNADQVAAPSSDAALPTAAPTSAAVSAPVAKLAKPVDFINLYDILKLPAQSAPTDLRKRITEMYLEAQKNQDHRNHEKKVYYQQLYEVYLPQARHLLLDVKRRTEYDGYLEAFREDQVRTAEVEEVLAAQKDATVLQNPVAPQVVTKAIEELMTPEKLAAYRADLWEQWEEGLQRSKGELAQLNFEPTELQQRAVARQGYMERVMIEVIEENRKMEERRERERLAEQERRDAEQARAREEEFQRRRDQNFDSHVSDLSEMARLYSSIGAGALAFLTCLSLIYTLNVCFYQLNALNLLNSIGFAVGIAFSGVIAWKGAADGIARVEKRVVARRDVKREATDIAQRVLTERHAQESNSRSRQMQHARNAVEELQTEVNTQIRLLHSQAVDAAKTELASRARVFAIGCAVLIGGSILMYLLDSILSGAKNASARPLAASVIWVLSVATSSAIVYFGLKSAMQKSG